MNNADQEFAGTPEPIRRLVGLTLRQKVFVNLIFVLLMVVGVFCVFDLPVERYPNVQMGKVVISGFLPGASPEDVEALVTRKIEDSLEDLENVEYVRSRSYRERSTVLVKFLDDTDYDRQYDELRFKVLSVQNDLPDEMDPPTFTKIDVSEWLPAISVELVGDRTNRALVLMAEEMKLPLETIPGVKEVKIQGEYTREFHVVVDQGKMMRLGVTYEDLATALQNANVSIPAGDFQGENGEYVIVVDQRFRSRQEVAGTVVRRDLDGSFVTVGDVLSKAVVSYRDPFLRSSVNSRDSVHIKVSKAEQGNALEIVEDVTKIVDGFRPALKREGVEAVLTQDQRVYIDESISTLGMNMMVGILLVSLTIWLVMGLRNAMLTTIGIPFSFLVTMIIMWITDNSLNEVTLFSFVLVSGIIVDDAIVVVENIYRHAQEGKPLREAVVEGASEVFLPVVAATSTTVAAFLPMLIMSGSTGEFFSLVPKAVTFAIAASLIECLLILPSHFLDWPGALKAGEGRLKDGGEPRAVNWLRDKAEASVVWALGHKALCLSSVFVAFVLALVIMIVSVMGIKPLINIQFYPDDYNLFYVSVQGPSATPMAKTSDKLKEISALINGLGPGMSKSASALAGMNMTEDYENMYGSNLGFITVELPAKDGQRFHDYPENDPVLYLDHIREQLAALAEEGWSFKVWPEKTGPPSGKDVNIRVLGPDQESVERLKNEVLGFINNSESIGPHLTDLAEDTGTPNRIFRFKPDPYRVSEYGLTPTQVAGLAGSVLDGRFVGKFRLADEDVDLRLKVDSGQIVDPEDALSIPVLEHSDGPVRLGDLCTVSSYEEPGRLNRFQRQRAVTLTANIKAGAPVSATSIVHDVKLFYETVRHQFKGASINFAGEYESTRKSYTSLMYAFFVAIMIMYVILATQFRSYIQPVIILSAVVFALVGVIFGTFVTRTIFTVNSFIATVGVAGVVVNDSLVLLDFINKLHAKGISKTEAVLQGVRIRLRPILLTTLTTTLGLLPMALGIPYYSNTWGTMATTFVTGLCTATALTVVIVPVEWHLLMALRSRFSKNRLP